MSASDLVVVERHGDVATLRLNRPEHGNAISLELAADLHAAVRQTAGDETIRCVVLTGSGRFFCVGGDISGFGAAGDRVPELMSSITDELHAAVSALAAMSKPLVTAVNGAAAGAGLGLAMAGDIVIAARSAHFSTAYTAIGLTPDGGTSWLLPRLIGLRRAQDMALTNRRVKADEAERIGLVTRLAEDAKVMDEAMAAAVQLALGATRALGSVRTLIAASDANTLDAQLALEAETISEAVGGPEGREGVSAFLGKRKPIFPHYENRGGSR